MRKIRKSSQEIFQQRALQEKRFVLVKDVDSPVIVVPKNEVIFKKSPSKKNSFNSWFVLLNALNLLSPKGSRRCNIPWIFEAGRVRNGFFWFSWFLRAISGSEIGFWKSASWEKCWQRPWKISGRFGGRLRRLGLDAGNRNACRGKSPVLR